VTDADSTDSDGESPSPHPSSSEFIAHVIILLRNEVGNGAGNELIVARDMRWFENDCTWGKHDSINSTKAPMRRCGVIIVCLCSKACIVPALSSFSPLYLLSYVIHQRSFIYHKIL
jgi:hypothetical protein